MSFGSWYFTLELRRSHKPLLFPDGSAEMPPVRNDGAGENSPLCCDEIALKHRGEQKKKNLRRRNIPPVRRIITSAGRYLFTGVIALSRMNGLAHMDGSKWLESAWMTLMLTRRADTSLSFSVIWNEGRAQCFALYLSRSAGDNNQSDTPSALAS